MEILHGIEHLKKIDFEPNIMLIDSWNSLSSIFENFIPFWDKQCNDVILIAALKDVSEHVGGSATFKYKLPHEGAPIEWIHNGKRIYPEKDPKKYTVVTDGLVKTLVIKDLKEDEQGTFGVKSGDKTTSAKIEVQGLCWAFWYLLLKISKYYAIGQ